MDKQFKKWIGFIIRCQSRLIHIQRAANAALDSLSRDFTTPTAKLFDRVIKINNIKMGLVNLKVLYDMIKRACADDFEFFCGYILCRKNENYNGLIKSEYYRKLRSLYLAAKNVLIRSGFSLERLDEEFGDTAKILLRGTALINKGDINDSFSSINF